jgi:cardiolipin synthase
MTWSWLPNAITLIRIMLVLPTAWLLWQQDYLTALVLMAIAGSSDALDGWLARRFHWQSRLGATLDPVADKLLVAVMFIVFTWQGQIPLLVALIVLGRDFVILSGAVVYRLLYGPYDLSPTFVSKANTAMQIVTVLLAMLELCDLGIVSVMAGQMLNPYCFYVLAVLGLVSGADYIVTWGRRAWHNSRNSVN